MDNITHTLTGLVLSRAGLNRLTPHATAILLLSANAPDLDIVTAYDGALAYLDHHRSITHTLVMLPALALAVVLVVALFSRGKTKWKRRWLGAFLAASVGVGSHLLLDWTNVYGIRMLQPFSSEWLRLDIVHVVDLWIWAILLLGLAAPALSRLVSSEIGARPGSGRGAAIFALLMLLSYEWVRYVAHERAVAVLESRVYEPGPVSKVVAVPGPVNLFSWTGLIQGENYYMVVPVHLLREFDPTAGRIFFQPEGRPEIEAARSTEIFRRYLNFSPHPLWRVTPVDEPEGAIRVQAMDLRFGIPPEERFVATAIVDQRLRVVRSEFSFGPFIGPQRAGSR